MVTEEPPPIGDSARQAEADLAHARAALEDGHFDWSSFAAQQAAENALKAVHLAAWWKKPGPL